MTLEELLNCSRPLYLETDIEGYDYAQIGSCALLRTKRRLLIGTARHCLWEAKEPSQEEIRSVIERLWIPQTLASWRRDSFGLRAVHLAHSQKYAAASDIVTLDVIDEPPPVTKDFCDLEAFPLCNPVPGDKMVIAGYPHHINIIQYPDDENGGKLIPRRLMMTGLNVGEGTAPLLGAMHLDEPDKLASYTGMSGSPVFRVRQCGTRTFAGFAGIAVREMTAAGTIDFIPATILRRVISAEAGQDDLS